MRTVIIVAIGSLLASWVTAHADSVAALGRPSSTVPGCVNA
ncbi:hypothetical protein [Acidisoma silvae]|nr:hypothetical protein [Acidisoma silvae]